MARGQDGFSFFIFYFSLLVFLVFGVTNGIGTVNKLLHNIQRIMMVALPFLLFVFGSSAFMGFPLEFVLLGLSSLRPYLHRRP